MMQFIVLLSKIVMTSPADPFSSFENFTAQLRPGQIASGLFEALPDVMFWLKDRAGTIVYANRAFAELLRCSPDDLLGKTDEQLFPPTLARSYRNDDLTVIQSAQPIRNKLEIVTRPIGGIEWRMTSKIPLIGLDGEVLGTAGVSRRLEHDENPNFPTPQRALSQVIDWIQARLAEDFSIRDLARAAGMSVSSLERRFHQFLGTTPRQYIVRARIAAACHQLLKTTLSIGQIATSVGYHEHASFTRTFTAIMHMSPKEYRQFYQS